MLDQNNSLYQQNPAYYDEMMSTELEELNFNSIIKIFHKYSNNRVSKKAIHALDLCCGTGIIARKLNSNKNIFFDGVDINKEFIDYAKTRITNENFKFYVQNSLKYYTTTKYDIVFLTSAYHHIIDDHKRILLKKCYDILIDKGILLVYEKAIDNYHNADEYKKVNLDFYMERIKWLRKKNQINETQYNSLLNVQNLSANSDGEFKVTYKYMLEDFSYSKFNLLEEIKTWPENNIFKNNKVGDFIFVLQKGV